jgi:uncharacterized lipoprotein YddW (UPF0748 family)
MTESRCSGSIAKAVCAVSGLEGRVMWCDAEANLWKLCTRDGVRETVQLCKQSGINTIIVDVKPLAGLVLYKSRTAPSLKDWEGKPYPDNYDLLQVMIEECKREDIAVHAAVNVFAEASQSRIDGPAHQNPHWQCVKYEVDGEGKPKLVRQGDSTAEHLAVFVNPAMREPRAYELSVIQEIVENYDIDGIILDRMRYPNLQSDFSDLSREMFQEWSGKKVELWPEDIFRLSLSGEIGRGPRFKEWLEWRASVIQGFLAEVRKVLKSTKPEVLLGVYVGSWYSQYYDVGVNWGSTKFKPEYDWTSSSYHQTGYADMVDYMCTGCYYEHPTREDAVLNGSDPEATVEAAGDISVEAVSDDTFVYGSLYVLQYKDNPEDFRKAIEACLDSTEGIMIFDLVYIRDYNWWQLLSDIFNEPACAPHEIAGLRGKVKDIRDLISKSECK